MNQPVTKSQPTVIAASIQGLIIAVVALLHGFEIVHWTPAQDALILGAYVALVGVITVLYTWRRTVSIHPSTGQTVGSAVVDAGIQVVKKGN